MTLFGSPVTEIITQRYSCRAYNKTPMSAEQALQLAAFSASIKTGPLDTPLHFELVAAMEQDSKALKGLGTYGLIKNPTAFLIGVVGKSLKNLEDFGYGMETIILYATSLGLETCWLGGNFTRSSFSRKVKATSDEVIPAVAAVGCAADENRAQDRLRQKAKSDTRLPWEMLFFQSGTAKPLSKEKAGVYAEALEMLRLAPSARNYQPWRVVQDGSCFHFYLHRNQELQPDSLLLRLLGIVDLQRVDIGIAMCHFELAAKELGLDGKWELRAPTPQIQDTPLEYVITWVGMPG
jgi:hypothetical protein